jgi:hypothetical protein
MRVYFDTEFIEDGKTIDLISIGMVREDGATLYLESAECDLSRASDWVKENVLVYLKGGDCLVSRDAMRQRILEFCGRKPEFWAYYADYDWVVLCQLFGRMVDLPKGWPMYCRDLKQEADRLKVKLPQMAKGEHFSLADASWVGECVRRLQIEGTRW